MYTGKPYQTDPGIITNREIYNNDHFSGNDSMMKLTTLSSIYEGKTTESITKENMIDYARTTFDDLDHDYSEYISDEKTETDQIKFNIIQTDGHSTPKILDEDDSNYIYLDKETVKSSNSDKQSVDSNLQNGNFVTPGNAKEVLENATNLIHHTEENVSDQYFTSEAVPSDNLISEFYFGDILPSEKNTTKTTLGQKQPNASKAETEKPNNKEYSMEIVNSTENDKIFKEKKELHSDYKLGNEYEKEKKQNTNLPEKNTESSYDHGFLNNTFSDNEMVTKSDTGKDSYSQEIPNITQDIRETSPPAVITRVSGSSFDYKFNLFE